jgi:hypothetical protein
MFKDDRYKCGLMPAMGEAWPAIDRRAKSVRASFKQGKSLGSGLGLHASGLSACRFVTSSEFLRLLS